MGAVMPSGKVLARTMAQYVDIKSEGPVVELGPGTGAITNATNKSYNAEFVLGGFAEPAPPREWTVEARYNF